MCIYFLGRGRGERERARECVCMNELTLQVPPFFSWKWPPASLHMIIGVRMAPDLYFGAALSVLGFPVCAGQLLFLLKSSSPLLWHIWNRHSLHRHNSGTCSITASLCSYRSELLWPHPLLRGSTSIVVAGKLITLGNWAGREVMLWGKKSLIPCPLPFWRNTAECGQG